MNTSLKSFRVSGSASPQKLTCARTGIRFVRIPSGVFTMGSPASEVGRSQDEGPQHCVRITKPFWMGAFQVTQSQYERVTGTNPSRFKQVPREITSMFPVEQVSWFDALKFCNDLSNLEGEHPYYRLTDIYREVGSISNASVTVLGGSGFRLPTEAEWEYACRAGSSTSFHFRSTLSGEQANINSDTAHEMTNRDPALKHPTPAGTYRENAFGLFDMHGNVWEWCEDVYCENIYSTRSGTTTDPCVASGSEDRVLRGGAWFNFDRSARSSVREHMLPETCHQSCGIRLARTLPAVSVE